jgi:hypothetical protein
MKDSMMVNERGAMCTSNDNDNNIPDWLSRRLPRIRDEVSIRYADGRYVILGESYDDVYDAYRWAVEHDVNFVFDPSVPASDERLQHMFNDSIGIMHDDGSVIMMLVFTDKMKKDMLHDAYRKFLVNLREYELHPGDFMASYHFVDTHPAFWRKCDDGNNHRHAFDWITEGHASDGDIYPSCDDSGAVQWNIETGAHTDDYLDRYDDPRLYASGSSLEDAYIGLAYKVHMFFDDEGNEIPDVEHVQSDTEIWYDTLSNDAG